ncbi:4Fe-4S binding protein [Desmonostoc muscorum LEGE 12446]|uniref:4Fe-4S binding protein n=1 Tax=Desmonostoc muscorum TaxID=1179 RepID=UPI001F1F2B46|nr:4Fe-4S binding protein [Desmonostoc muscorum]MCF2145192.1 4Fe-4S binding protein [Desmonostoc muscorum LEGE 12446]
MQNPKSKIQNRRSRSVIELVSESRCIKCNICVNVCPTNVFERVPDAPPTIARQSDCQTCYMCELYCPVDALYVAPQSDMQTSVNEAELVEVGLLGSYRENVGWGHKRTSTANNDQTFQILKQMK